MQIIFYYDIASPHCYLAAARLSTLAERTTVTVNWHPVRWPAPKNIADPAAKQAYDALDVQRLAAFHEVPLHLPHKEVRSEDAMRLCMAFEGEQRVALSRALFEAVFVHGRPIDDHATLLSICEEQALNAAVAKKALADKAGLEALQANERCASDDDVFDLPAVVCVDKSARMLFTGVERLRLVAKLLDLRDDTVVRSRFVEKKAPDSVDFYYDFVSPYAYLAATQIEALTARQSANVNWKPIFLGGLFQSLGRDSGPVLNTFSRAKQSYVLRDMGDWADFYGIPWHWPSRFPINTVLPLRLMLAVDSTHIAPLSLALFRAYWKHDRDISNPDVVREVARHAGIDDATVERACNKDPALKQGLVDATAAAQALGVFGTPTMRVHGRLFWGQDRLPMVERALAGWDPPC